MSDVMTPISFGHLMRWIQEEYEQQRSIFGIRKIKKLKDTGLLPIFNEHIEQPFGPAAGPHTQLAQNIIAAYVAGARFFELKTVQIIDGEDLAACVAKPCIAAEDECYNCEWSTELTVEDALAEYVKAWFACKLLSREYELGRDDGFVFNMSVGYDLEGIKSPKVNSFIENLKDASKTEVWNECLTWTNDHLADFKRIDQSFVDSITPHISCSITESTLHGCPPDEIERIAAYLIKEKGLNTYVKCNPTLLGYEFARKRLDELGFNYVSFDSHHFDEDLHWEDAVPMFERLIALADQQGLEFGVKLSNTFPVEVCAEELPSEEMYMSGRSLFPLTIHLARLIAEQFNGSLRISYSGGADIQTIRGLFDAGIWPITLATALLKPGGYERLAQMVDTMGNVGYAPFSGVDTKKVVDLDKGVLDDVRYCKPLKPALSHKVAAPLSLLDCFEAGCRDGCPIKQDIPAYLRAVDEGRFLDALTIIIERNALPFMTGILCPHPCATKCMRSYYDEGVRIREYKLRAAEAAYDKLQPNILKTSSAGQGRQIAIVGGGPAGLACAYFLGRAGARVTIFEQTDSLGGAVRRVIPRFRISDEAIDKDIKLCLSFGAKVETGRTITSLTDLKNEGFDDVVVAVGAWKPGRIGLSEGEQIDVLDFLEDAKYRPETLCLGSDVVVVGAGNTAMDAARAAKRLPGVERVRIVYRRKKQLMPADEEELNFALEDGVELIELRAPKSFKDNILVCNEVELGEKGSDGRQIPVVTKREVKIPATAVICAVGEKVDTHLAQDGGVSFDTRGYPVVFDDGSCNLSGVWFAGDCKDGAATIVEAIADAAAVSKALLNTDFSAYEKANLNPDESHIYNEKGNICLDCNASTDSRCLGCPTVCEVCCDVCPNRANIALPIKGFDRPQIVHIDALCNECGNCAVFCPWEGRPYRDKLTVFWSESDMEQSENPGFYKEEGHFAVRLNGKTMRFNGGEGTSEVPEKVKRVVDGVCDEYGYLLGVKR